MIANDSIMDSASNAFSKYESLTGATEDNATGLLKISTANYAKLESLFFNIGSSSYELTKDAQTWPRALNTAIGGSASSIYLVVADVCSISSCIMCLF